MKRAVRDKRQKLYKEWTGLHEQQFVKRRTSRKIKALEDKKYKEWKFYKELAQATDNLKKGK